MKLQLARVVPCVLFLVQLKSSWSAVEDTLSSWPREQCCSVLALPRRAFCVWGIHPRVAWGSCRGAECLHPWVPGRGQVAVLPTCSRGCSCRGSGALSSTRGAVWRHSPAQSCDMVSWGCSFPSLLSLPGNSAWCERGAAAVAGRGAVLPAEAGHGRTAGWAGWATRGQATTCSCRHSWSQKKASATPLLPSGTGHCQLVPHD